MFLLLWDSLGNDYIIHNNSIMRVAAIFIYGVLFPEHEYLNTVAFADLTTEFCPTFLKKTC